MSLFTQIVILLVVLSAMVMVLLAIRQLTKFEGFTHEEETIHLKEEVEEDSNILSSNNIFNTLVDTKRVEKPKHYKSNSRDPLSRKE